MRNLANMKAPSLTVTAASMKTARLPWMSALLLVMTGIAQPAVTVPAVLTDHMVVQRERPIHCWGKAIPGENVSVTFRDVTRSTTADPIGLWSVYLPPSEAGGPFDATIKGENTIVLRDVLVGDIWIGSGQSNMEWPLKNANNGTEEVAKANFPRIRLFQVKKKVAAYPQDD